mmetsp:Transcript_1615/g.3026  ORF Transcript_1615/g.3026 Transcript_1615/m.3026 type:complete len:332 (-) Transcript_1615:107-1102(-)
MLAFSAISLFLVTGASANTNSNRQNHLPITHARSLGMKAIKKAHSRALASRRMETGDDTMDFDFAAMTDEQKNQLLPMVCQLFNMGMGVDDIEEDMETEDMFCSDISCDNSESGIPTLKMGCTMEGEYCDEDAGEEFCVKDTKIDFSMGIDFVGSSNIEATQCATYTKPDYMAEMGNGCVDIHATMDIGKMMGAEALVEAGTMTAEEVGNTGFAIAGCSAKFKDGTSCECESCNGGMGFELDCNNALVSEECSNFDADVVDMDSGASETPDFAVLRLVASPGAGDTVTKTDASHGDTDAKATTDGTSPAASCAGGAVASLTLVFASLQALM